MAPVSQMLFLVRPDTFGFNEETASTNNFQKKNELLTSAQTKLLAMAEFDACVKIIENNNINHVIYSHQPGDMLPDAVFPNNWFCHLPDQRLIYFPMASAQRRNEKIPGFDSWLKEKSVNTSEIIDLSFLEKKEAFLEGTGSLILDHYHKIGWAALSLRTSLEAITCFSEISGYHIHTFQTIPFFGVHVYHTNVMMAIAPELMVLAEDIICEADRTRVIRTIGQSGREILPVSLSQMENFCCNVLFVANTSGKTFWIMSETAFMSFLPEQIKKLSQYAEPLVLPVSFIESCGGGSARCMLAELFP